MAGNLRDVPYKLKMIDDRGLVSNAWSSFFRDLFSRAGGRTALSNIELQETISDTSGIQLLQDQITILNNKVSRLETETEGLGVGPSV